MSQDKQVALVTGGNRGIGYELVKQLALNGFKAILASRDLNKGHAAAQNLIQSGLDVSFVRMDVDDWQLRKSKAISKSTRSVQDG